MKFRPDPYLTQSINEPLVRVALPAKQQFRVVLALQVAVNEVGQQVFEDVGGVLQSSLQGRHDE